MRGKTIYVSFRQRSDKGDVGCDDGEIEDMRNLRFSATSEEDIFSEGDKPDVMGNKENISFESSLPDAPKIEFGLERKVLTGWHNHLSNLPTVVMPAGVKTEKGWGEKAKEAVALFMDESSRRGFFTSPFFVLYAVRLADGNRILPGPPVLMIPNSGIPEVGGTDEFDADEMKMTIAGTACSLQFRVNGIAGIKNFEGRATHLDIFVSHPLATIDTNISPICRHRRVPEIFSHSLRPDGNALEHTVCEDQMPVVWSPEAESVFKSGTGVRKISEFYMISEIEIKELQNFPEFRDVEINCADLALLSYSEKYSPDYAHLQKIESEFSQVVSGRMTLCGLKLGMPIAQTPSSFAARTDGLTTEGRGRVSVEVESLKSGEIMRSSVCVADDDSEYLATQPPRWIFFPDPDAFRLTVMHKEGSWSVRLRRHPSLYGSYYYSGMGNNGCSDVIVSGTRLESDVKASLKRDSYCVPSGIWRSEICNPYLFPQRLFSSLEIGRCIALCRAFRASGLIATTSPTLYLFTDEGIFLLKEMDDGSLRDAGLIGRYVLKDASSFKTGGGFLDFIDVEENVWRIEGTKIRQMSGFGESADSSAAGKSLSVVNPEESVSALTRPIKFGNPGERERIGSVEILGNMNPEGFSVCLEGSDNLRDWHILGKSDYGVISGLWNHGSRFCRVRVSGSLEIGEDIEGLLFRLRE